MAGHTVPLAAWDGSARRPHAVSVIRFITTITHDNHIIIFIRKANPAEAGWTVPATRTLLVDGYPITLQAADVIVLVRAEWVSANKKSSVIILIGSTQFAQA